ncbi:MAG: zinc-binding alcohol dehydrogenase family protein [Solidesulfovibrio sp. DCME]|uniref:zinc-binding alcohol dehydrogenase family protein n=1 Tax=Solidesulfovibrio sp. DCME TaxID=3447380 RepID=UPI003D138135
MHAVIATGGFAPADPGAFRDATRPTPRPTGRDVLVDIQAVGVNPVDTKVFDRLAPGQERILGWDARGVVAAVGPEARRFSPGQAVFYAGELARDGSNAASQLVDERLVAAAPASLAPAAAAGLPLTGLTAWEGLFDRLGFTPAAGANQGARLLVVGGAGGVGSMVIQLAAWAGLTVAATAGRPESAAWCRELGAMAVIGREDLATGLRAAGLEQVEAIYCTTHAEEHWAAMAEVLAPQGAVCLIDDPAGPLDIRLFKQKSARICWEFMFTRSLFATADLARQGLILESVARLVDEGHLRTTLGRTLSGLTAETVRQAHLRQRTGTMVGKQVIVA